MTCKITTPEDRAWVRGFGAALATWGLDGNPDEALDSIGLYTVRACLGAGMEAQDVERLKSALRHARYKRDRRAKALGGGK